MARKYTKHGSRADAWDEAEDPVEAPPPRDCWLCERPCGETVIWHHPIPKSRGGRDTVPMHPICQSMLITTFTNSELQRNGLDAGLLRIDPRVEKFIAWVSGKEPDFNAPLGKKKQR
ncbi:hypothetical protein B0I00_1068 [Novosphingobium kunmingense]|uniref:HNH endonuclease n=1 Tax=Novosphingobium kunmingense TaxID=1211806 RepID=A0A2N0I3V9_9SPHN|nr:hypothetical protein [Novosphingobium kunmingense]PKB25861.1 hypothetical protein B0I00_1068 [Novosphingobium kunmingense]